MPFVQSGRFEQAVSDHIAPCRRYHVFRVVCITKLCATPQASPRPALLSKSLIAQRAFQSSRFSGLDQHRIIPPTGPARAGEEEVSGQVNSPGWFPVGGQLCVAIPQRKGQGVRLLPERVTGCFPRSSIFFSKCPVRPHSTVFTFMAIAQVSTPSKFINPREAAAFLGLDDKTITRWARKGYIPAHPMGEGKRKSWRFVEQELSDWLMKSTNQGAE
jgi:excisionase family DNA binding protein